MDETESSSSSSEMSELQAQCRCLHLQVQIILIFLIMVSGVFTTFLRQQNKYATQDLGNVRNSILPMVEDYSKNQAPMMDDFVKRLMDYSHTHPDFAGISTKYGLDKLSVNPSNAA